MTNPSGSKSTLDFNPRTREGCDGITASDRKKLVISIHAPVKGATNSTYATAANRKGFQSTHP